MNVSGAAILTGTTTAVRAARSSRATGHGRRRWVTAHGHAHASSHPVWHSRDKIRLNRAAIETRMRVSKWGQPVSRVKHSHEESARWPAVQVLKFPGLQEQLESVGSTGLARFGYHPRRMDVEFPADQCPVRQTLLHIGICSVSRLGGSQHRLLPPSFPCFRPSPRTAPRHPPTGTGAGTGTGLGTGTESLDPSPRTCWTATVPCWCL